MKELSSAVEEINRASTQIMTALDQINRGTQQQSAATQEASKAIAQIEKSAQTSNDSAVRALAKGEAIAEALQVNRASLDRTIAGVQQSVESNIQSRAQIVSVRPEPTRQVPPLGILEIL